MVEDRQSQITWQTVNEVSKIKSCQPEERIQKWKEHLKNFLGNSPKITDKPITKMINSQPDIKLRQLMEEELNIALTKIKNRKAGSLYKIPCRQGNLMT